MDLLQLLRFYCNKNSIMQMLGLHITNWQWTQIEFKPTEAVVSPILLNRNWKHVHFLQHYKNLKCSFVFCPISQIIWEKNTLFPSKAGTELCLLQDFFYLATIWLANSVELKMMLENIKQVEHIIQKSKLHFFSVLTQLYNMCKISIVFQFCLFHFYPEHIFFMQESFPFKEKP